MEKRKRERSIDKKTYALIMENSDIGLENTIVGPNDYIL